jgi:hypothetical protein
MLQVLLSPEAVTWSMLEMFVPSRSSPRVVESELQSSAALEASEYVRFLTVDEVETVDRVIATCAPST